MGKFNIAVLRYLTSEDFRVLTAVNNFFPVYSGIWWQVLGISGPNSWQKSGKSIQDAESWHGLTTQFPDSSQESWAGS